MAPSKKKRRHPAGRQPAGDGGEGLFAAVVAGDSEAARLLLDAGADPSRAHSSGVTPI